MLNASQVKLGNEIMTGEKELFRVIGGAYGTVENYYLLNDNNMFVKKADTIEELLDGVEVFAIGEIVNSYKTNLDAEDDANIGDLFVALTDNGLEARVIVGSADGSKFFAIDPITGLRKSRTKNSIEELMASYDEVLVL